MKLLGVSHLEDFILPLLISAHFSLFGCPLSQFKASATTLLPHLKGPSSDLVSDERMPFVLRPDQIYLSNFQLPNNIFFYLILI